MTDKEFINDYIKPKFNIDYSIILDSNISNNTLYDIIKLKSNLNELLLLYGTWFEKELIGEISNEINELISEINNKLNTYTVRLGTRNWECVDSDGKPLIIKTLVDYFNGKGFTNKVILSVYNMWYNGKVYDESEKNMKNIFN
jgi:hypothetical protein